jgi:hypothetical protein
MLWRVLAIVVPLILLAYLAVIDFADLFPWNDIAAVPRRERAREAALNYPPLLIAAIGFALDNDLMRIVALVMVCAYTIGNALAWWVPYLIGGLETPAGGVRNVLRQDEEVIAFHRRSPGSGQRASGRQHPDLGHARGLDRHDRDRPRGAWVGRRSPEQRVDSA